MHFFTTPAVGAPPRGLESDSEGAQEAPPVDVRPPATHPRMPALDGVRGLAIAMVLAVHTMHLPADDAVDKILRGGAHWGWTGVDLFFVLSGFLITGILFDAKQNRARYFRNFYARRMLRIFPLYYAFIAFALLIFPRLPRMAAYYFGPAQAGNAGVAYWLYLSNFTTALTGDAQHGMLDVSWSLAIEEQFYLIWPLVVFMLDRDRLMRVCVWIGVVAISVRTALGLAGAHWLVGYTITPCRMDALAAGALVALAVRGPGGAAALLPIAKRVAAICGAMIIGLIIWHRGVAWLGGPGQAIGYSAVAGFYASLIILILNSGSGGILSRTFTFPGLTILGRYSYAMYLFHLPIAHFVLVFMCKQDIVMPVLHSQLLGELIFVAISTLLTLALALISWNVMEKHFIKLKEFFDPGRPGPRRTGKHTGLQPEIPQPPKTPLTPERRAA
jgi:peptidoglycan/LPS O-acetylase OafA/YrhL